MQTVPRDRAAVKNAGPKPNAPTPYRRLWGLYVQVIRERNALALAVAEVLGGWPHGDPAGEEIYWRELRRLIREDRLRGAVHRRLAELRGSRVN